VIKRRSAERGIRLRRYRIVSGILAVLLLVGMAVLGGQFAQQRRITLRELGIAVGPDGATTDVTVDNGIDPRFRVIGGDGPENSVEIHRQNSWLAAGRLPVSPTGISETLVRDSLLDLYMLSRDYDVAVAGWVGPWRYVWPRDSAFVTSAFARTGHLDKAKRNLDFLQQVQPESGVFDARYLPDWSGRTPDSRGVQLDGAGWALWALGEVARFTPVAEQPALVGRYRQLLVRSTNAILNSLSPRTGLPSASPDYWETKENRATLANSAILLAGLQSSARLFGHLGDADQGRRVTDIARGLEVNIARSFGPSNYSRYPGGPAREVDLGVTFLQAPFVTFSDAAATQSAWKSVPKYSARPGGGLAPGGGWRDDGISWTSTVATYAMAAACIDPPEALRWLGRLDRHRTSTGALPEKVLQDGSPASVAPLAWTAAAVIIAVDELERGC
jgi:glucoamylase